MPNLFGDVWAFHDKQMEVVPGSMRHLSERILNLDAGATVLIEKDVYVPQLKDGAPVMVLKWAAGEYVTPAEAALIALGEKSLHEILMETEPPVEVSDATDR